jgi:TM2 domain-containing membrane protein YozV/ribosomal protein L40E
MSENVEVNAGIANVEQTTKIEPTQQVDMTHLKLGKFCSECGSQISVNAVMCPKCGASAKGAVGTGTKNPGTAAVLSFFWTGLGQIYNGEILKGILLMVVQVVNVLLMFVVIGIITFPIVWVYGIWDAHKRAQEINAQ